jgi:hypothetical protein
MTLERSLINQGLPPQSAFALERRTSPLFTATNPLGAVANVLLGVDYTDPPTGGTALLKITTVDLVEHVFEVPFDLHADDPENPLQPLLDAEFGEGVAVAGGDSWPASDVVVIIQPGHGLLPLDNFETDATGLTGGTDVVGTASDSSGEEPDPQTLGLPVGSEVITTADGTSATAPAFLWKRLTNTGILAVDWTTVWSD